MPYNEGMRQSLFLLFILFVTLGAGAQAQTAAQQLATQSRISVLSKAGAPVPRPSVPVRYVQMPAGAQRGIDYYYGGYGYGYGYGAQGRARNTSATDSTETGIPGLVTRPRSSYGRNRR